MIEILSLIYDTLGVSKLFSNSENDYYYYKAKSITNINSIDYYLNHILIQIYNLMRSFSRKNINFEKLCEFTVYLIEYTSILFVIFSFIYFISYLKESIKNILQAPSSNSNYQEIFEKLNKKISNENNTDKNSDNILLIKNKSTGEYEKFKLIRLLKDCQNLNSNNNNESNSTSKFSNRYEMLSSNENSEQSIFTFQSTLQSPIDSITQSLVSSKTKTLLSKNEISNDYNDDDIIKVNSLSMLSQIVINKNLSNSTVLLDKKLTTNSTIKTDKDSSERLVIEENEINERLKKLNSKRILSGNNCIFTCITYCLMHVKNEEFWMRFEKKSNITRPNLQKIENRKDFIIKLRRIVHKFWMKNLLKFFNYLQETSQENKMECRFKNENELKLEMKNYLNDGYCNTKDMSLDYTIPCIISTCLQINIILIRCDSIVKLTPDILGKIDLINLPIIYLIQKTNGTYEATIKI